MEQLMIWLVMLYMVGVFLAFQRIVYIKSPRESEVKASIIYWTMCLLGWVGLAVVWMVVESRGNNSK